MDDISLPNGECEEYDSDESKKSYDSSYLDSYDSSDERNKNRCCECKSFTPDNKCECFARSLRECNKPICNDCMTL